MEPVVWANEDDGNAADAMLADNANTHNNDFENTQNLFQNNTDKRRDGGTSEKSDSICFVMRAMS